MELSYISGNGNHKKLICQEVTLLAWKKKKNNNNTGCLSNLYYLVAAQASSFLIYPLSQTQSDPIW